jgi:hypothetical protein
MKTISRIIYLAFGVVAVTSVAFLSQVQAVVPPPDGGYPNLTTAEGDHALKALTTGVGNTAVGTFSLFDVSTGNFNTAVGAGSLDLNQADSNTATGAAALLFNTTGTQNTANGTAALEFNDTGSNNTAQGAFALLSNTTGGENTANGFKSLFSNTAGSDNTAMGDSALFSNTSRRDNTAIGYHALADNTGDLNTATGWSALSSNTTGAANTADGKSALLNNTTGNFNTAIGETALQNNSTGYENTAIGHNALAGNSIGHQNTAIGVNALENNTTATNVTCLNADGDNVDGTTWIGGIFGATVPGNAVQVFISPEGQLAAVSSSRRFKKEIKSMDKASEAILALKPMTFHYKSDKTNTPQFGLIAEEVAALNPDLIVRDKNGEIYSGRYDAVNAMLLNEFLKEHRTVQAQGQELQKQAATIADQQKQIEASSAGLQKVSAHLETDKSTARVAKNN